MPEVVFEVDQSKSMRDQVVPGHNRWHPDIPVAARVRPGREPEYLAAVRELARLAEGRGWHLWLFMPAIITMDCCSRHVVFSPRPRPLVLTRQQFSRIYSVRGHAIRQRWTH